MRGLIEVKHISSSQFTHGADTQLPIYMKGEKAPFGIYLCIRYFDKDFAQGRLDLVNVRHDPATRGQGRTPRDRDDLDPTSPHLR
jgi:hypothetical protein